MVRRVAVLSQARLALRSRITETNTRATTMACRASSLFLLVLVVLGASADDEDLDLLELDLEDPQPLPHQPSSSLVSLAQQKKALVDLSDHTALPYLSSKEHVLLLGYAPWCSRSSELMPDFAAAALALQELGAPVSFAKIDGAGQTRTAARYGIKGFPTLLFFTNGTEARYTGGFTRNEIAIWVKKHIGMPASRISSRIEAEEILSRTRTTVVGYFSELMGSEYDAFISAAKEEEGTEFVAVDNAELARLLNEGVTRSPPFLSILKNEPETYVPYESTFEKDNILWFVEANKHPLVTKMTRHNYMKLYASPIKLQVTLFEDAKNWGLVLPLFQEVAKIFKGKILFLVADTDDEELSRPTLTLYGLEPEEPIVTAFNYGNGIKYLLESELTKESFVVFCEKLIAVELHPHYKSAAIPTEKQGDLHIVVGKNFDSIVLDESKDVFLEVYTPWCLRYDAANKAVEAVAKQFKDIPSLIIAKIDASANEHPLLEVDDYPTFLLYPATNKTNPISGPKKWNTKKLAQFVHEHCAIPHNRVSHADKDEL